jgi:hypothetical protein
MKINTSLFLLYLQEEHEKYQSMYIARDMYSMAANVMRFENLEMHHCGFKSACTILQPEARKPENKQNKIKIK